MKKYMDLSEFQSTGLLQEANRLLFHPLGLALEITFFQDTGTTALRLWDCRHDPEGIIFDLTKLNAGQIEEMRRKAAAVNVLLDDAYEKRTRLLGGKVQPIIRTPIGLLNTKVRGNAKEQDNK